MNSIDEQRRDSFGSVAELYDLVRPSYPDKLVEDVARYASITEASRILEIGAGTGKATRLFCRYNAALLAVEPSPEMAQVLERNTQGAGNVEISRNRFEDLQLSDSSFDLVFSAQAFHWVPKDTGYAVTSRILKPGGAFALFYNASQPEDWDPAVRNGLDVVYARHFPGADSGKERKWIQSRIDETLSEIVKTGIFPGPEVRAYPWKQWYSTESYLQLLDTYSEIRVMENSKRTDFLSEVRNVLDKNRGGIEMPYQALLFLARRK